MKPLTEHLQAIGRFRKQEVPGLMKWTTFNSTSTRCSVVALSRGPGHGCYFSSSKASRGFSCLSWVEIALQTPKLAVAWKVKHSRPELKCASELEPLLWHAGLVPNDLQSDFRLTAGRKFKQEKPANASSERCAAGTSFGPSPCLGLQVKAFPGF